jgi:hypothetical protein
MVDINKEYIDKTVNQTNTERDLDFLRPNSFRLSFKDLPHTAFTCQAVNIPAVQMNYAVRPTPFIDIPTVGDKMTFGDLTVRFIVTEGMSNYLELYNWLIGLGFPKDYTQFSSFASKKKTSFSVNNKQNYPEVLAYSDATLSIMDSTNNPKVNIIYKNIFPVSLGGLEFDIVSSTVDYFVAYATFKYSLYDIEVL